ncbi:MAG: polysaccharide deacetylase family protein [Candidatus Erginobacter occultus]|nr:polysaccharide deacetylase family protein [Candidatus Erginobacter occultus]
MNPRLNIPILMYHSVSDSGEYGELPPACRPIGYRVSPAVFSDHLSVLLSGAWTPILPKDLAAAREGRGKLPPRPVILTFDDGYADNLTDAFPLLRSFGFRAAFFLSVSHLGRPGMLTWDEAARLRDAGMEIGSHGLNHELMAQRGETDLRWELEESRRLLAENLALKAEHFSLPRGYLPPALPRLARRAGYRGLCTSRPGFNTLRTDPFRLRRFPIRAGISTREFRALLSGRGWGYGKIYLAESLRDLFRLRHRRPGEEGR